MAQPGTDVLPTGEISLLQECSDDVDGQACIWTYGDKGGISYFEYSSCSRTDILLPGFNLLPNWLLAVAYGLCLIWTFFGIAIISDIFMSSIEVITSMEREVVKKAKDGTVYTLKVLVWNASVANLTLMALGSSAPEIMIAIIETVVTLGDTPGELGPSTIVGSAAFNLLLISAVCIVAVPEGEAKSISEFPVFIWTAFMSLWAYLWMLIVYKFWTPNRVTMVEALLTLAFLPLLVAVAYLLDAKPWAKAEDEGDEESGHKKPELYQIVVGAHGTSDGGQEYIITREEIQDFISHHQTESMDESEIAHIIAQGKFRRSQSGLADGTRAPDLRPSIRDPSFRAGSFRGSRRRSSIGGDSSDGRPSVPWYERPSIDRAAVLQQLEEIRIIRERSGLNPEITAEDIQSVVKAVQRKQSKQDMSALQYRINARNALTGRTHLAVAFPSAAPPQRVATNLNRNSAPADVSLVAVPKLMFASEEYRVLESQKGLRLMVHCDRTGQAKDSVVTVKYSTRDGSARGGDDYAATDGILRFEAGVSTQVIEVTVFEDDLVEADEDFFVDLEDPNPTSVIIQKPTARVTIVDTTEAGMVQFKHTQMSVARNKAVVHVPVIRKGGCTGVVTVDYATQTDTVASGLDFEHTAGKLTFEAGESQKMISVPLIGTPKEGKFTVCLKQSTDSTGVEISRRRAMCSVEIVHDDKADKLHTLMENILERHENGEETYWESWAQQFRDAVIPGAELDEDGEKVELSIMDVILHYLSITWKLIFAIVPPPELYHGGPCFVVSLMMIGGLTYFVAPIASMFGCAVGLSDLMTAIVFVAVGTSLPDTFASHQAAVQADDADAAIGNVTGSNSVNVFLGLGLPWLIAASYYQAKGQNYDTPAGPLSFSVMIFMVCATFCLCLLVFKRTQGGELGGSGFLRRGIAGILVVLWFFYLIMSGLQDTDIVKWDSRR